MSCRFFYSEVPSVGVASPRGDIKPPLHELPLRKVWAMADLHILKSSFLSENNIANIVEGWSNE
jgi:hypothetical protein